MSTTTQCPHCGTRFKASQAQLEAYHGMVRCGHCQSPFDAVANRCDEGPHPQMALPIAHNKPPLQPPSQVRTGGVAAPRVRIETVLAPNAADYPELSEARTWPWAVASVVAATVLLAQAAYIFRVDIAARAPGLKPALLAGCEMLHCEIPLPQNADLVSLESSDLEADPAQGGIITLSFTLRNRASYAQAYPNVELTLTDSNDVAVGRRSFRPAEYLRNPADEKAGLPGSRENAIRLTLDTTGVNATGYRLFLYY